MSNAPKSSGKAKSVMNAGGAGFGPAAGGFDYSKLVPGNAGSAKPSAAAKQQGHSKAAAKMTAPKSGGGGKITSVRPKV